MIRALLAFALATLVACLGPLGLPSPAEAQQSGSPRRIGFLLVAWSPESKMVQAFRQGLRDGGYVEGRDVVVELRYANGDYDRVPQLAADLVQSKVDVIVADSTPATRGAMRATSTIPIVMTNIADPVGSGLVANLAHPGGNVTGFSTLMVDLSAKRLELLKETIPRLTRVGVLWNTKAPYSPKMIEALKAAAPALSIELKFVGVRTAEEIDPAVSAIGRAHVQALYVIDDSLFEAHRVALVKLASKVRLPTMNASRSYPDDGGLMSYGASYSDLFRRSAGVVDKILKGIKPGDLPIEQPTKFELVINLKTARAFGLTIPESVLSRADEVIR